MKTVKLGEIAELTVGFVGSMTEQYVDEGVPFLRSLNIKPFEINNDDIRYISEKFNKKINKSILHAGDVVIVRTGAPGTCCVVPEEYDGCNCSDVVIVRPNIEMVDPQYLAGFVNFWGQKQISNNKVGAIQQHFNVRVAEEMLILLPDLDEQRIIANILGNLNRKIRVNKAINDNLQQQLKLLYDYWFTQFDFPDKNGNPYHTSGGQMVWNSELKREIPADWSVKSLSDILIKNTEAFDYKSELPAIDLSVMPSNSIALEELNSSRNFNTNLYVMQQGDILFGSIRPYLHKAGFAPCDGVVAGTVHSYKTKKREDYNFALFTLCRNTFFDYAVNVSVGTKMPVINSNSLLAYKVAYCPEIVEKFNSFSVIDTIAKNIQENQQLIALRDWLLPMLMNGQIIVSD